MGKREKMSRSEPLPGAPTIGALTRGSGSQLVNAACFLIPDVDARGNTVTHGFILVPAAGRTSSKGVCEGTVLSCTRRACREWWPEHLLRWAGEVGVTGLRLGERSSMR